jgi:hypothetical protein
VGGAVAAGLIAVAIGSGAVIANGVQDEPAQTGAVGPTRSAPASRTVQMTPLRAGTPVTASVALLGVSGGTSVHVKCRYQAAGPTATEPPEGSASYQLVVVGQDGSQEPISSWSVGPGEDREVVGATRLSAADILRVEIRRLDGRTVLTAEV